MPGKLCFNQPNHSAGAGTLQLSKAYAEGRLAYDVSGTGAADDNPHLIGSPAYVAWEDGFDDRENNRDKGCSAV